MTDEVRPVLLVRARGGDDRDAEALAALGLPVVEDPWLVVGTSSDPGAHGRAERTLDLIATEADVLLLTSRTALVALAELVGADRLRAAVEAGVARGLVGAAVGPRSAEALADLGLGDVLVPEEATARGLLAALRDRGGAPARAVLPCGAQAMRGLADGLRDDRWEVDAVVLYDTSPVAEVPASAVALAAGAYGAIVLRSPTAVRAVAARVATVPATTAVVCGGPTTAAEARARWSIEVVVSPYPTAAPFARTVAAAVGGAAR